MERPGIMVCRERLESTSLSEADAAERPPLDGWQIAIAGRLASLSRDEFATLVAALGGKLNQRVDSTTTHLVVGERTWPLDRQGRLSPGLRRVLRRKHRAKHSMPAIEILSESDFLRRLSKSQVVGVAGPFTLTELARLTGVSPALLRHWASAGWLKPSEVNHGVAYYRYAQVSGLRRLAELVGAGVSRRRLAKSLMQLRRWVPEVESALVNLVRLSPSGRIAVRLSSGKLTEPSGQLLIDFDAAATEPASDAGGVDGASRTKRYWDGWTFDELCDFAVEWEQMGRLGPAAELYEYLLGIRPDDAEIWFNYGNTLYASERIRDAAVAYRAALKHDPQMADAWNNLGVVLEEQNQVSDAEAAFRQALSLAPDYSDARENLDALLADRREQA